MKPVTLDPIVYGDTWGGLTSGSVDIAGSPPESALSQIRMFFRRRGADPSLPADLELSTTDGTILITSAAAWNWEVPSIARFPLEISSYDWSLEFTDASDFRQTYVTGTIQVTNDATR